MKIKVKDTIEIKLLFKIVEEETKYTREEITSTSRLRELTTARMMTSYILSDILEFTTMQTGHLINRDHSSVVYFKEKHHQHYRFEKQYRRVFDTIKNRLAEDVAKFEEPKPLTESLSELLYDILNEEVISDKNRKRALDLI